MDLFRDLKFVKENTLFYLLRGLMEKLKCNFVVMIILAEDILLETFTLGV